MGVTIKDVARIAGVDPSTVSRVIADSSRISKATKEKVTRVMEELDFYPNAIARSLANKSTRTIGVIMPLSSDQIFANPFFTEVMRGIGASSLKRGYDILFSTGGSSDEEHKAIKRIINEKKVDGLILLTSRMQDKAIKDLIEKKLPFVVIGKPSKHENINWVDNDNFQACYDATEHFIEQGHRDIGFIGGEFSYVFMCERFEGYKQALHIHKIEFSKAYLSIDEFLEEGGYKAMKKLLGHQKIPSAVIVADDLMAFGAIRAIKEKGLRIPEDIAIVGFNDTLIASYIEPTLSSVEIFVQELGYNASEILINQLENPNEQKNHIIIKTNLKVRKSSVFKRG